MIDEKRINEAEKNVKQYLQDNWLFVKRKDIAEHTHFFLRNAETSILTADLLYQVSVDNNKKIAVHINPNFESFLWVIVSSYYAMFYSSLALFATNGIKVGDKLAHKVVEDTLIAYFLKNEKLAKLIEQYEQAKSEALQIMGAEQTAFELIQSFEYEREKRHRIQYELGSEAKHNLALTSLNRARKYVAEIRNIIIH